MLPALLVLASLCPSPLSLAAKPYTLVLVQDPVRWPQPSTWVVQGTGYREKWVTISVYHSNGALFNWGPWAPGRSNTLNKEFHNFTSGDYIVEVRRGYQQNPGVGPLLISGTFTIP